MKIVIQPFSIIKILKGLKIFIIINLYEIYEKIFYFLLLSFILLNNF